MNADGDTPDTDLSRKLAALAHPARIEILRQLARDDGRCCKDVVQVLDLAQSTVSQHLKVLVGAGLVRFSAEGKRSRYCLDRAALEALSAEIDGLFSACSGTCAGPAPRMEDIS